MTRSRNGNAKVVNMKHTGIGLSALVAVGLLAGDAHPTPTFTEWSLPTTSPAPSAIDWHAANTSCYIDAPNAGIGLFFSSPLALAFYTFTGASFSEQGIRCSNAGAGSANVFAADTTNNALYYMDNAVSYVDTNVIPSGNGGPYAIASTGPVGTVYFSTYTTAAASTVYIGGFTPNTTSDALDLYALPSTIAGQDDIIAGVAYSTVSFASGAVYFTVYSTTNSSSVNILDLNCSVGSGGCTGKKVCTLHTFSGTKWAPTSATQVSIDGNGAVYSLIGDGADGIYRWDYGSNNLDTVTDLNYSFTRYISNQTWTGSVPGLSIGSATITLVGANAASISPTTTPVDMCPYTLTPTTAGTKTTPTVSAGSSSTPGSGTGTKFDYIGTLTTATLGPIALNPNNNHVWFTEKSAGKIALYTP